MNSYTYTQNCLNFLVEFFKATKILKHILHFLFHFFVTIYYLLREHFKE